MKVVVDRGPHQTIDPVWAASEEVWWEGIKKANKVENSLGGRIDNPFSTNDILRVLWKSYKPECEDYFAAWHSIIQLKDGLVVYHLGVCFSATTDGGDKVDECACEMVCSAKSLTQLLQGDLYNGPEDVLLENLDRAGIDAHWIFTQWPIVNGEMVP